MKRTNAAQSDSSLKPPKTMTLKTLRTLGPVSDLERHLPTEWWKTLFNALYLKTDGDVVENDTNTVKDIDILVEAASLKPELNVLDLCCGQGRHSLELAKRGFKQVVGIDRSRFLVRLARKRAKQLGLEVGFSEGDARQIRSVKESSQDCVFLMGNSFGYFEHLEDDIAVLNAVKRALRPAGTLVMDIVDGAWMAKNFEARSWEWIDQNHFVNRERSLDSNGKRIITREIVSHSELGVLADQFYAERLYTFEEIKTILESLGFHGVVIHTQLASNSTRGQDLGMMANRMFIVAKAPFKEEKLPKKSTEQISLSVILGDPQLPDQVKRDGKFNTEDLEIVQILKDNLKKLGSYDCNYLNNHKTLIEDLLRKPPGFVLNLCDEGYGNRALFELHVPALLELLNIPYTGAGPGCLALCYNKALVRAIADSLDVPVPMETYYDPTDQAAHLPSVFPALLKPNTGDSSIGITKDAVVYSAEELITYMDKLRKELPDIPILIQEFLQGTEYSIALLGNAPKLEALPILEVDYSKLPKDLPKILSYESKWTPDSPYWDQIDYVEAHLEGDTRRRLIDYSRVLFERLGCRDYARFDFRADSEGNVKLLEVNPNPGWCWDGKLNLMAGFAGMDYSQLLDVILSAAKERLNIK